MFKLHDTTRRFLCQAAFVLLGVVPLLGVGGWCWLRHANRQAAAEAEQLSRQLGATLLIADMEHVRPGAVRYRGVALVNPETRQIVARCAALEARHRSLPDAEGVSRPTLELTLREPEVMADQTEELARVLLAVMQSRTALGDPAIRVTLGDLALRSGSTVHWLTGVDARVDTLAGGVQAEIAFRVVGLNMGEPAKIRVGRNRQLVPPATGVEFSTGDIALPCTLLAAFVPEFGQAGLQSQFQGWFWANAGSGGWSGAVAGQLSNVDLDRVTSQWTVHKISGLARLELQAAFRQGRLEKAAGNLVATKPDVASRSFLAAAVERLGLGRGIEPLTPSDLVPYDQLALGFEIDTQGVVLKGLCHHTLPGTILAERYQPLLSAAPSPQPIESLVRALAPAGASQVPANQASERLMRLLPLADGALSEPLLGQRPP